MPRVGGGATTVSRSNAGSSYGCARRRAATTSRTAAVGQAISSRTSAVASGTPGAPIAGFVSASPVNVPVPVERNEHSPYLPIRPAPAR